MLTVKIVVSCPLKLLSVACTELVEVSAKTVVSFQLLQMLLLTPESIVPFTICYN